MRSETGPEPRAEGALEAADYMAHAIFEGEYNHYSTVRAIRDDLLAIMRRHGLRAISGGQVCSHGHGVLMCHLDGTPCSDYETAGTTQEERP